MGSPEAKLAASPVMPAPIMIILSFFFFISSSTFKIPFLSSRQFEEELSDHKADLDVIFQIKQLPYTPRAINRFRY